MWECELLLLSIDVTLDEGGFAQALRREREIRESITRVFVRDASDDAAVVWHGRTTLFKRLLKINSAPTFISRQGSDSIILMLSSSLSHSFSLFSLSFKPHPACLREISALHRSSPIVRSGGSQDAGEAYGTSKYNRIYVCVCIFRRYWSINVIFEILSIFRIHVFLTSTPKACEWKKHFRYQFSAMF